MARPTASWLFAEMFFQSDGKEWSTEFWFSSPPAAIPTGFDANELAATVQGQFEPAFIPMLFTGVQILGTRIECNFGTGTIGGETHSNTPGTNTNTPIPYEVATVVRKATALGGRSHAGRWRISGLTNDQVQGSYLSTVGQAFYAALVANMTISLVDQGITWTPCVYSRKLNVLTAITSAVADLLLGTARRRRNRF